MSAEKPSPLGTRPVIQTSTTPAVAGWSKVNCVVPSIVPSATGVKLSRSVPTASATRISTVAPGLVLVSSTPETAWAPPRSRSRPTPSLRLPNAGEPR